MGKGLLTRLWLEGISPPSRIQFCYYRGEVEGGGEKTPLLPNSEDSTPRLDYHSPTTAKFQRPRPPAVSLLFLPLPSITAPPPQLPQTSSLTGRSSHQRLSFPPKHMSISESRGRELVSRVYCIIHATRTCTERTGCSCTSTKPQMHHKGRLQGISRQYSISPRTIAKFICEKIHCNVLF